MKPGRIATMTHDYERHGTTTLFAALNVLDGTVISHNMKRHCHQEFIRFLNTIEAQVPKRKAIHAIVDNYARPINIPRCANGLPVIDAGPSTLRRPQLPGSTPSRASSPRSRVGASSAASSDLSTI